jgi:sulfite exporter TauE/SafE
LALILAIAAYRAWPRGGAQERDELVQIGSRTIVAAPQQGKRPVHRSALLRLLRHGAERPALLGLLSVFIPCAALWSGLVIAASAGSASAGATAMVAFSLTSGTGLLATGFLAGRLRTRPRHHRILSLVFAAGALILVLRPIGMQQASASSDEAHEVAPAHCPLHAGGLP